MSSLSPAPVGKQDFEVYRSDTFETDIFLQDESGAPIDITSWTAKMEIRLTIGGTIVETFTELDGLVIDGPAGKISMLFPGSRMDIATEQNVYDLELTEPDTTVQTIIEGLWIVRQDVTR